MRETMVDAQYTYEDDVPALVFTLEDDFFASGASGLPMFLEDACAEYWDRNGFDIRHEPEHDPFIVASLEGARHLYEHGIVAVTDTTITSFTSFIDRAKSWSDDPVLITGDRGVGKELAVKFIHEHGPRGDMSLLSINCAAITGDLLMSELFGHKKGSFTGAIANREGYLSQADGGVLFLDEVDHLSLMAQGALLRFLETKEVCPLGSTKKDLTDSDVQIFAATNKPLESLFVGDPPKMLPDFFDRINGLRFHIPNLSVRDDAEKKALAEYFILSELKRIGRSKATILEDTFNELWKTAFAGNIREMRMQCRMVAQSDMLHDHSSHFWAAMSPQTRKRLVEESRRSQEKQADSNESRVSPPTQHLGICVPESACAYSQVLNMVPFKKAAKEMKRLFGKEWFAHQVAKHPGCSQQDIAKRIGMDASGFSRLK